MNEPVQKETSPAQAQAPADTPANTPGDRPADAPGGASPASAAGRAGPRKYDAEESIADILQVATAEFAAKGLAGARIDEIAAITRKTKRMIYYYFGSKEGLYLAVLEAAYERIRKIEATLRLEDLPPEDALRRLVAFTFDYHHDNEDFIRLVMSENMNRGEYLGKSDSIQALNVPAISAVEQVYERGLAAKVFRQGLDPVDLHMSISALCFYNLSNRHTFSMIFKRDMVSAAALRDRRETVVDLIVRFVRR